MGHAVKVEGTLSPPPPVTDVKYLLVRHRRARLWPVPACAVFHLEGGSPMSDHVHLRGKMGEKEGGGGGERAFNADILLHSNVKKW